MSKVFYQNALNALKKANKKRRQKMAEKNGFKSYEEYRTFLEGAVNANQEIPETDIQENPEVPPTILVIDVLDTSASMHMMSKASNALAGIKANFYKMIHDPAINYWYQLIDFDNYVHAPRKPKPIHELTPDKVFNISMGGSTALNDAILNAVKFARDSLRKGVDNVLINLYTDGQENASYASTKRAAEVINELPDNITITAVCVKGDRAILESQYGFDDSNLKVYDNTGEGLKKALVETQKARASYSLKVSKGENVARGFYKTITTK
jgi:hypothetical protein